MSATFYTDDDRRRAFEAQLSGHDGAAERRQQAQALRRLHEDTNRVLHLLPFAWQPGIRKPKYLGERFFEQSLPAVHLMLMVPVQLEFLPSSIRLVPALIREPGDWLCRPAVDKSTGELRYEGQKAPQWADGTGGPASHYDQQPTCKNCLKWAHLLLHG